MGIQSTVGYEGSQIMSTGVAGSSNNSKGKMLGSSNAEVFSVMELKERDQVVKVVRQEDVSLGMEDPSTGRSLLHKLLTTVTNGDKIVVDKLDSCISASGEDVDDDGYGIIVDHKCLVDEDTRSMVAIKDLLHLPNKITTKVLSHPVIMTFIEKRWLRTRWTFLISFALYLTFVLLFSSFLWLMYERYGENDKIRIPVKLPRKCEPLQPIQGNSKGKGKEIENRMLDFDVDTIDVSTSNAMTTRRGKFKDKNDKNDDDDFVFQLEVVKQRKNRTKLSRARKHFALFSGCRSKKTFYDLDLCLVEIFLVVSIVMLVMQEFWQCLALGKQYFMELENWFELLILSLAISTLSLKAELDSLQVVAAVGICLAWIELIFLFGRYPFLGGSFSIMYYSITKRIIKTALGFIILVCAFAFAFFIIHFGNETESFDSVGRSFLKIFVMVLGEFEFDDLWSNSESSSSNLSRMFTMFLLIGLIILGSMIMVNLIVAIIISDIEWLNKISKEQALLNQAHHAVQIHALRSLFQCLTKKAFDNKPPGNPSSSSLQMSLCVHSVCHCGKIRPAMEVRDRLMDILLQNEEKRKSY